MYFDTYGLSTLCSLRLRMRASRRHPGRSISYAGTLHFIAISATDAFGPLSLCPGDLAQASDDDFFLTILQALWQDDNGPLRSEALIDEDRGLAVLQSIDQLMGGYTQNSAVHLQMYSRYGSAAGHWEYKTRAQPRDPLNSIDDALNLPLPAFELRLEVPCAVQPQRSYQTDDLLLPDL